mmetsp:Transcript_31928/g.56065  ORF Transcript_31928/g.56065 Transcript_31928/m.56065 type:complete len:661 (-) Transcript_31928:198-2180(-)|eukprot:CAMPEP_0197538212 /NCGR_PEP_ID=MMETSP1318-20131121/59166_1 /TAXON_ID=552666 /ORGANISM="Partenskyella glossopodia, Strain RCC365" /LENGTH=660 /DNA_ID=CAMNT_0043096571 /DNA_START=54 /DNA_END=2036 /DNA_ORIENTATION=-
MTSHHKFKTITPVPEAKDFIDVILSKTQRKTPTVVHRGYKISRIRSFYIRKVKFTQCNYHERLTIILTEFPRLEEIHPFYADLMNVLYSRDHYKLALGQLNTARNLIDGIAKDYIRMIKYGDSLYRCKQLKRAALGRMCTLMRKMKASLGYLEQVRQHLSRLPDIDPTTRTLLITGYPNVGKSSFINKISRADVEVQNYAFTTKSLFVGHFDYQYHRWQVIDTPGILDHPLEDRNTIEMQAITALAHLNACVLFFVDISEECGYTIQQQVSLFHNIKPLFSNKPLVVVCNKIDLKKPEEVEPEDQAKIKSMLTGKKTKMFPMSNVTEEGIHQVKSNACEVLLTHRVQKKLRSSRAASVMNRLSIQRPEPRDNKQRGTSIPQSVLKSRQAKANGMVTKAPRSTEKDLELRQGGPGVYNHDQRKYYMLKNPNWKYDVVPEILDGKNVADFVDPDIEKKLQELEAEEDELQKKWEKQQEDIMDDDHQLTNEEQDTLSKIRTKKSIMKQEQRMNKSMNSARIPRSRIAPKSIQTMDKELGGLGLDTSRVRARSVAAETSRRSRRDKRRRADVEDEVKAAKKAGMEVDGGAARGTSTSRVAKRNRRDEAGMKTLAQKQKAAKLKMAAEKKWKSEARKGAADRRVLDLKPKHLNSGKSGIGKRDWR